MKAHSDQARVKHGSLPYKEGTHDYLITLRGKQASASYGSRTKPRYDLARKRKGRPNLAGRSLKAQSGEGRKGGTTRS